MRDIMSTMGMFSTVGDIMIHVGGYHDTCGGNHEYCGGVQYHEGYHEYHGDIMMHVRRYHEYHGGVQYCGGIS